MNNADKNLTLFYLFKSGFSFVSLPIQGTTSSLKTFYTKLYGYKHYFIKLGRVSFLAVPLSECDTLILKITKVDIAVIIRFLGLF